MEITLSLRPSSPLNPLAMDQLMHWAAVLEGKAAPDNLAHSTAITSVASDAPTWDGPQQDYAGGDASQDASGTAAEHAAKPGRGGRKKAAPPTVPGEVAANAAVTADLATAAAALAVPPTAAAVPPVVQIPPTVQDAAPPPVMQAAIPPTVVAVPPVAQGAIPPVAAVQVGAQPVEQAISTAIPPAMAHVPPAPVAVAGEIISVEQMRAECVAGNEAKAGLPFNIMRAPTWRDGTQKGSWMSLESVPAECRSRIVAEIHAALLAG